MAILDGAAEVVERITYDACGRARHMAGADVDGDGQVELDDLTEVISNWGNFGVADSRGWLSL